MSRISSERRRSAPVSGGRRRVLAAVAAASTGSLLPSLAPAQPRAAREVDPPVRHDSSPYVPTPQTVVDEMLRMGRVGARDFLIDLGSGDGRIVITAAQRMGARGLGVDLDPELVRYANAAARRAGVGDLAQFVQRDIFQTDLTKADVVTMYLLPEVNMMARPKLLAELRPGSRVVTHDYHFEDWVPDERITLDVPEKKVGTPGIAYIYLWIVPGQGGGRWQGQLPVAGKPQPVELDLQQRFQILSGKVTVAGRPAPIVFAEMVGDELRLLFNVEVGGKPVRHDLRVTVKGDEAMGNVTGVNAAGAPSREPEGDAVRLTRSQRRAAFFGEPFRTK